MKSKNLIRLAALLVLLTLKGPLFAQFILSGEIREKPMFKDGYKVLKGPGDDGYVVNNQRVRLNTQFEKNDMGFVVTIEDVRTWGESKDNATVNGLGLAKAYFYINFCKRFNFTIGRQTLDYDDGRYLTNSSWGDPTLAHDAFLFKFRTLDKRTAVDFGSAISNGSDKSNFLTSYDVKNLYKYFVWAWAAHSFWDDDFKISFLSATDFNQKAGNAHILYARTALSAYFYLFSSHKVSGLVYAYGQWGHNRYGEQVAAYLASAKVQYKMLPSLSLELAYDFVSGNDFSALGSSKNPSKNNLVVHGFDRFFGGSHGFLGYLDYFVPDGFRDITQGAGLHQPYLRIKYQAFKKHNFELAGRYFALAHPYIQDKSLKETDPNYGKFQKFSRNLGGEIDFLYTFQVREDFSIQAGYSFYLPTTTLERLNGIAPKKSKFSEFAYLLLTYKPVLFDSEKHQRKHAK